MKKFQTALPWIVLVFSLVYAGQKIARPDSIVSKYDLNTFRQLPVSDSGRTKPIDTVARNSLRSLSGKQTLKIDVAETDASNTDAGKTGAYKTDTRKISAIEWYIELITKPEESSDRNVIRIDHPEVKTMIGETDDKRKFFSFNELMLHREVIFTQADKASKVDVGDREAFQNAILVLSQRLGLYNQLIGLDKPYLVPPMEADSDWRSLITVLQANPKDPNGNAVLQLLRAYNADDIDAFNAGLAALTAQINTNLPYHAQKSRYEVVFSQVQPFFIAIVLFVIAFLFGCFGMLTSSLPEKDWSKSLFSSMTMIILVAFLVQTVAIVSRIYLQGRPPITNLYSSAIFIGWFCVIIGLILDRQTKMGIGGIMASVVGFGTLIVAQNLGSSGDTMEMMQAVLDSNFWLATHVVVVTIGYSATFFAGFLAIAYVLLGLLTPTLDRERGKSMIKMVYGVICFATVTSFVGTVLGGIWADQSWGRFWGWDAKENGAALIVLWNLLILHARWGGMIKDRGIVILAIFGNIITAWSWFGTNMLGVGLHSYGFTQSAVFWLLLFVISQLVLMGLGMLPLALWRSKFARPEPAKPVK